MQHILIAGCASLLIVIPILVHRRHKVVYGIGNHSLMHNVIDVWEEFIALHIKK